MLVYVDESGQPHPNDRNERSALVAVCIENEVSRVWTSEIYELRRQFRPANPKKEIKAADILNRYTFRNKPPLKELVEQVVNLCLYHPLTIFAVIMPRPTQLPNLPGDYLPNPYRYLLQRVNALACRNNDRAVVIFDEAGPSVKGQIEPRFTKFMMTSLEGRSFSRILETPLSVKSESQSGIQIADLFAGVIRQYHENRLAGGVPQGDDYLWAIKRYYDILKTKTLDLEDSRGRVLFGFYLMPEKLFYITPDEEVTYILEEEEEGSGEESRLR